MCGVVGSYSDLLLKLRKELFSCLFKNFEADTLPTSAADYSNLLPYFMEYTRLESERKNHAKCKKCLPVSQAVCVALSNSVTAVYKQRSRIAAACASSRALHAQAACVRSCAKIRCS